MQCLSRAIQTALLGIPSGPRFVVDELLRERIGTHPCDKRRCGASLACPPCASRHLRLPLSLPCSSRAEIAADFPSLDLSGLTAEDDPAWTPEREPMPALIARADAWLDAVSARP